MQASKQASKHARTHVTTLPYLYLRPYFLPTYQPTYTVNSHIPTTTTSTIHKKSIHHLPYTHARARETEQQALIARACLPQFTDFRAHGCARTSAAT